MCTGGCGGGDFFKSREEFFSETESKFQLKMSNDDDVETEALQRERDLERSGRIQHQDSPSNPGSELQRCRPER